MRIKINIDVIHGNKIVSKYNSIVSSIDECNLAELFEIDDVMVESFLRDDLSYIQTHGDAVITIKKV